jgi:hypothetical protein
MILHFENSLTVIIENNPKLKSNLLPIKKGRLSLIAQSSLCILRKLNYLLGILTSRPAGKTDVGNKPLNFATSIAEAP